MAYDEDLANGIREQLAGEPFDELRMFGGLAFTLGGNTAVCASRTGGLMVRVGKDGYADARAQPHAEAFTMGGRVSESWVIVSPHGFESDETLAAWVRRGTDFARSLPPKDAA